MLRNIGFIGIHKKKLKLTGEINKKIEENYDIPLEEILSDDTIIPEIENHNKILLKYLDKDRIKQMIDYIIKEPPNDADHNKGYKFPWICSQIFELGDSNIMKFFLKTNRQLDDEDSDEEEREKKNDDKSNIKININEITQQLENEDKIELLDYLLTFLSSDAEQNYVLCGYFASILKTLLKMERNTIIKYLYQENKESIKKLINSCYRQSISEIISQIIIFDTSEEEFNVEEMSLTRMEILEGLFDQIDINMDNEKLESFSTLIKSLATDEQLLIDLLNNRIIINCLITIPLKNINLIEKNVSEEYIINKRRNFIILIDIIVSWMKAINTFEIDLPSADDNDGKGDRNANSGSHTLLSYELFRVLGNLIKINFNKNSIYNSEEKKILQSFDGKLLVPLGQFRIKIVELLGHLFTYFKYLPLLYDKLLINCKFFENAFQYLFEYELNNIYQETLLMLFKKFLNYSEDHPLLADYLFIKLNLIDLIISKLKDSILSENQEDILIKDKFLFESGNSTSRGYIAFLISLSYKINTIIGGDPLRINNTLSREGSISFISRAAPFVGKEEINEFYGMDENELYEDVANECKLRSSNINYAIKSMEKYANDKWYDFFDEYIANKIRLYETKLYKDDKRDSVFHNPFILDEEEDNLENNKQNNFGLGEDEDVLGNQNKNQKSCENFLYGEDNDADMDINLGNRFKMSMRLPRSNNSIIIKPGAKRGSMDNKPAKVVVDEIDEIIEESNNDKNNNEDNKNKNDEDNKKNEEENPLDKFKRLNSKDNEEENPLDKFRKGNNDANDDNENEEENALDKFRRLNSKDKEEENKLDKFKKGNNEANDDNENEEENPLDKFRRLNSKDKEEENPLDKFRRLNSKDKEEENPLDKFKKGNNDANYDNENEEENALDKFKRLNSKDNEEENPLDLFKKKQNIRNFNMLKKKEKTEDKNIIEDDLYD